MQTQIRILNKNIVVKHFSDSLQEFGVFIQPEPDLDVTRTEDDAL